MSNANEMVHYRGAQYRRDLLPKGADPAEVTPIDEWFAANKQHKAILEPTRVQRIAAGELAATPPARPAKAQGKVRPIAPAPEPEREGTGGE